MVKKEYLIIFFETSGNNLIGRILESSCLRAEGPVRDKLLTCTSEVDH